jgi:hypothetical protein
MREELERWAEHVMALPAQSRHMLALRAPTWCRPKGCRGPLLVAELARERSWIRVKETLSCSPRKGPRSIDLRTVGVEPRGLCVLPCCPRETHYRNRSAKRKISSSALSNLSSGWSKFASSTFLIRTRLTVTKGPKPRGVSACRT